MSQRQQQIMDAALALYSEGGVSAVTIQALVARAPASTGSIYHHFGSLEGVLGALYQRELQAYRDAAIGALEAEDARELIHELVGSYLRFVEEHPESARYLFELRFADAMSDHDDDLRRGTGAWLDQLRAKVLPLIANGTLKQLPEPLYVPIIMGPATELSRLWLTGRTPGIERLSDVVDTVADAAWQAIRG